MKLHVLHATTDRDFEGSWRRLAQLQAGALIVGDHFSTIRANQLGSLPPPSRACDLRVSRVRRGRRLMSYGASIADAYRQGRSLCRPHPQGREARRSAGQQPTKFELVINLKTAKALGLDIPPTLLARADEVIE